MFDNKQLPLIERVLQRVSDMIFRGRINTFYCLLFFMSWSTRISGSGDTIFLSFVYPSKVSLRSNSFRDFWRWRMTLYMDPQGRTVQAFWPILVQLLSCTNRIFNLPSLRQSPGRCFLRMVVGSNGQHFFFSFLDVVEGAIIPSFSWNKYIVLGA